MGTELDSWRRVRWRLNWIFVAVAWHWRRFVTDRAPTTTMASETRGPADDKKRCDSFFPHLATSAWWIGFSPRQSSNNLHIENADSVESMRLLAEFILNWITFEMFGKIVLKNAIKFLVTVQCVWNVKEMILNVWVIFRII